MVQARVRVHKLPVFSELAKEIAGYCPKINLCSGVLDVGCGDGFFLSHVTQAAIAPCLGIGVDVSKEALVKAARNNPNLFFVRADASNDRLPFKDSTFGLVLSIFAPRPIDEIRRVLRAHGSWLIVTANQDHLAEIRSFLPLAQLAPETGRADQPFVLDY